MTEILARNRISNAVLSNVPAAADREIAIGSKVLETHHRMDWAL